jgi:outer membrane receptor protein involved in Fe transport
MPEAIILNVGAEYHKDNSAVYAQLANLFNRKEWVFSEQPGKGRNFYIGLKHRF